MFEIGAILPVLTNAQLPRKRRADDRMTSVLALPDASPIPAKPELASIPVMPEQPPGANATLHAITVMPLAETITELRELQAQRKFCIKTQQQAERSVDAFIARTMGYSPDLSEADRKALWGKVSTVRKAVENGGGHRPFEDHSQSAPTEIILLSAASRKPWDDHRKQVEKRMGKLARLLPAWEFVEGVRGLGDLGLAVIIGETGDLSNYDTKERVWKRLGLAVMDGFRQGDPKRPDTSAKSWIEHGYSGKRRSEIWNRADSLFKAQWRGAKDDVPAHPIGPYGVVYQTRKAATETRDWSPKHRDNDARRVMTKALIEDLWKAWRRAIPEVGADPEVPAAESQS